MKTSIKLCSILFLCLILFACSRDNEQIVIEETEIIPGETTVLADVYGVIIGPDEVPIPDVEIVLSGRLAFSDENGVFKLEEVDISSEGSLVIGTKDGYYQAFKFTYAQEGQASYLQIRMIPKEVLTTFPSTEDIVVETNGGALISLPANITRNLDGSVYSGEVRLSAHWYSPTSDNLAQTMPGDLRGRDMIGNNVQLTTYGMMAVELESPQGEKLQLADGQTARLSFPITDNIPEQTIPMWHLNESTGIWEEEGEAEQEGNFLVAEVPHFSFWNCDAPFDVIKIQGQLITSEGIGIPGQIITITNNRNLTSAGLTNANGVFCGKIPSGVALVMVIEACGNQINIPVGPFTVDTDLGEITIDGFITKRIISNLLDCNSDPVQDGYFLIRYDGEIILADIDAGAVDVTFLTCDNTEGEYFAFDLASQQQSEIKTFDATQDVINESDFLVCGDITEEFISFAAATSLPRVTFSDAEVTIIDDTYIHIFAESDTSEYFIDMMYLKDPGLQSDFISTLNILGPWVNGDPIFASILQSGPYIFEPTSVQEVGDLVTGSINTSTYFDFALKVDRRVTSATVIGEVWEDTNTDGLMNDNEPRLSNLRLSIGPNMILLETGIDSTSVSGKFEFNLLIPDREYRIYYRTLGSNSTQPNPTVSNIGTNEAIDSDFTSLNSNTYSTTFILGEGDTLTTLDLGVLP